MTNRLGTRGSDQRTAGNDVLLLIINYLRLGDDAIMCTQIILWVLTLYVVYFLYRVGEQSRRVN